MWKFLRSKAIWVALSGMMLAAGTLFTAVDEAKAYTIPGFTESNSYTANGCSNAINAEFKKGTYNGLPAYGWLFWGTYGWSPSAEVYVKHEWSDGGVLWFVGSGGDTTLDSQGRPQPATNGMWNRTQKRLYYGPVAYLNFYYWALNPSPYVSVGSKVYFYADLVNDNINSATCADVAIIQ